MNSCDYYLMEMIVVRYDDNGETLSTLCIRRSKTPRWFSTEFKSSGMTRQQWVEENEDLVTRVVYEEGHWNVSDWENSFYVEELAELNVAIDSVQSIKRVMTCRFHAD
jgi:hypothetical protein